MDEPCPGGAENEGGRVSPPEYVFGVEIAGGRIASLDTAGAALTEVDLAGPTGSSRLLPVFLDSRCLMTIPWFPDCPAGTVETRRLTGCVAAPPILFLRLLL